MSSQEARKNRRIWTGVYNSTPDSLDFTRGDCETLDWWDWEQTPPQFPDTTSCVTANVNSTQWRAEKCGELNPFACQSWEWADNKACTFKNLSMSCVWDAHHSYMQTAFMMCEMMCGYTPRCWGYMSGNFQPTPDGKSFVITDNTGCTMIMADAASTCRHINQTYFVQFRAWRVVLDAGFLRVCPIQPHFLRRICLTTATNPSHDRKPHHHNANYYNDHADYYNHNPNHYNYHVNYYNHHSDYYDHNPNHYNYHADYYNHNPNHYNYHPNYYNHDPNHYNHNPNHYNYHANNHNHHANDIHNPNHYNYHANDYNHNANYYNYNHFANYNNYNHIASPNNYHANHCNHNANHYNYHATYYKHNASCYNYDHIANFYNYTHNSSNYKRTHHADYCSYSHNANHDKFIHATANREYHSTDDERGTSSTRCSTFNAIGRTSRDSNSRNAASSHLS
nr:hypothetical protein BaRGS_018905 [Batillaria attramentaria]